MTPESSRPEEKWACPCDVANAVEDLEHEISLALIDDTGWQTRLAGAIEHYVAKVRAAGVGA